MTLPIHDLLIGTTNDGKRRELAALLAPHGLTVRSLADVGDYAEVVEDGATFAENARKKATEYARAFRCWVLADDSGLEVDALDGAPGIYSARFAGSDADDDQNNRHLLERLAGVPPENRTARYWCHVAVANSQGHIVAESSAGCTGRIREACVGTGGFGYDPLFEVREYHRTFGQLGPHVKQALSHRARAMRAIVPKLLKRS